MTDHATALSTVRRLTAQEAMERTADLSAILVDCVEGGASVSFLAPLAREKADRFWRSVAEGVAAGDRALLVAEDGASGDLVGTVQIGLGQPENQPHRAALSKMLVRRSARRRGLGGQLMHAAEEAARAAGKTLLVLDTATGGDAERLYARLGWTRVGVVPGYALMPDGRPCDTTIFYKHLSAPEGAAGVIGADPTGIAPMHALPRSPGRKSSFGLGLLALLFAAAGVLHFLRPDGYVSIVPHFLPAPRALVFASGVCEVLLGLGLLMPRAAAGVGLIALLVAVFPANIQMLLDARASGAASSWLLALWLRLPLQAVLAFWVFRAALARRT